MPGGNPFDGRFGPDGCIDRDIGEQYKVVKAVYDALVDGRIPDFLAAIADDQTQILDVINSTFFAKVDVDCSGNLDVVLTVDQSSKGLINLSGTPMRDINVVFPDSGRWVVFNTTTGGHRITAKTAAGEGVSIVYGKSRPLFADGVNMIDDALDFQNLALPASTTAANPLAGDDSQAIATTHWVKSLAYITAAALAGYATEAYVLAHIPSVEDLSSYATEAWVDGAFDVIGAAAAAQATAEAYADAGDVVVSSHANTVANNAQANAIAHADAGDVATLAAAEAYANGLFAGAASVSAYNAAAASSGGTVNPSVSFTAPGSGTLVAFGIRNNAVSGSNAVGQLTINGTAGPVDSTQMSMVHMWAARTVAGAVSASYSATNTAGFTAYVLLFFIPDA